jgi:hypothetical protein
MQSPPINFFGPTRLSPDSKLALLPEIKAACERFGISLETWRCQERAFGLLKKVNARVAAIRGQQLTASSYLPQHSQDWPTANETDEYSS